ncbi:hypothetical protein ACQKKK_07835 [Peribacillus sp. NPDC006672]|uniref:hypothetical protein n=1 Tax=Peribacillus sp. NPDC006672 TaxID=3390606 RepID=UPI003CFF9759
MGYSETNTNKDMIQLINELEKPEVQESLTALLGKLPDIQKTLESAENIMDFGKSVVQDKESINKYEQTLSTLNINGETVVALITLIEKVPKLVSMIEQVENIMDFVTDIIKDKESTDYLLSNLKEYTEPILKEGKDGLSLIKRVKERADCNPQNVTIISVMKWMKDPTVKRVLCYVQAALEIINEKNPERFERGK